MTLPPARVFHSNPNTNTMCTLLGSRTMRSAVIYLSLTSLSCIPEPVLRSEKCFIFHYANKMQVNGRRLPAPLPRAPSKHISITKQMRKQNNEEKNENPFFAWCVDASATRRSPLSLSLLARTLLCFISIRVRIRVRTRCVTRLKWNRWQQSNREQSSRHKKLT